MAIGFKLECLRSSQTPFTDIPLFKHVVKAKVHHGLIGRMISIFRQYLNVQINDNSKIIIQAD